MTDLPDDNPQRNPAASPTPSPEERACCKRCGAGLTPGEAGGLCPACLLAAAMEPVSQGEGSEPGGTQPLPHFELPPSALLGDAFPKLEILECIGRGGMGAVYKVRQKNLERLAALKILSPRAAEAPGFAERFQREARALARLNHPGIVTVHEFGESGGYHYLLMEYVDGASLRQVMRAGKLPPAQALAIVPEICAALQYAHDQGVVHRDIKPENILMDKAGRVKIADFGLAKMLNLDASLAAQRELTQDRQVMGTPNYMAPEQVERPRHVDHRADIYSLGVVFYEMLTGELPLGKFQAPSCKVSVDVRLDEVVLKALAKEPERRYQHASDVKSDVEHISRSSVKNETEKLKFEIGNLGGGKPGDAPAAPLPKSKIQNPKSQIPVDSRLSRTALAGAIWAPMLLVGIIPFLLMFSVKSVAVSPGMNAAPGPGWFGIILMIISLPLVLLAVTAPVGTTICGCVALGQIRRSAGRLYGLGLALFDALVFPLLALDVVAVGLWWWFSGEVVVLAQGPWRSPVGLLFLPFEGMLRLIVACILVLLLDWLLVRACWRAATRSPAGGVAANAAPAGGAGRRFGLIIILAVCLVLLAPPLLFVALRPGSMGRGHERTEDVAGLERHIRNRVFECDAETVNRLVPPGVRAPVTIPEKLSLGGATNGAVAESAEIDAGTLASLLPAAGAPTGLLRDSTREVPWWPQVADTWGYANADAGRSITGGAGGFIGLRRQNGVLQLRTEYQVHHGGGEGTASSILFYEGNAAPAGRARVFFVPLTQKNGGSRYLVVTFEPVTEQALPLPDPGETAMSSPPPPPAVAADDEEETPDGEPLTAERVDSGAASLGKAAVWQLERFRRDLESRLRDDADAHGGKPGPNHAFLAGWLKRVEAELARRGQPPAGPAPERPAVQSVAGPFAVTADYASMPSLAEQARRECGLRVCLEDQEYDMLKDGIRLGAGLAALEKTAAVRKLSPVEQQCLDLFRRQRQEGMAEDMVVDVGPHFSGHFTGATAREFLDRLTATTPYQCDASFQDIFVIRPRVGSVLNFPVTLNTRGMMVADVMNKLLAQQPVKDKIGMGMAIAMPVAPGTDPMPWLSQPAPELKWAGDPAWQALTELCRGAKIPMVWNLAGYRECRMLGLTPAPAVKNTMTQKGAAPVAEPVVLGPAVERTLRYFRKGEGHDVLWLADGAMSSLPTGFFNGPEAANREWLQRHGPGLFLGTVGLQWGLGGAGIKFAVVPDSWWTQPPGFPELAAALAAPQPELTPYKTQGATMYLLPENTRRPNRTLAFQDDRGLCGLLRAVTVLDVTSNGSFYSLDITVCYKLARTPGVAVLSAPGGGESGAATPTPRLQFRLAAAEEYEPEFWEPLSDVSGQGRAKILPVLKEVLLDESAVASAGVTTSPNGNPQVTLQFTAAGRQRFAKITGAHVGKRLAMVFDNRVLSAPVIRTPIDGGMALIEGNLAFADAKALADLLNRRNQEPGKGAAAAGWGEPVEGVAARVTAERDAWDAEAAPVLRARLCNTGTMIVVSSLADSHLHQVEVDGRWYRSAAAGGAMPELPPGGDWPDIRVVLAPGQWLTADKHDLDLSAYWGNGFAVTALSPREPLRLTPGRHTIRVAFAVNPARALYQKKSFRVISNPVTIEVRARSAASRETRLLAAGAMVSIMERDRALAALALEAAAARDVAMTVRILDGIVSITTRDDTACAAARALARAGLQSEAVAMAEGITSIPLRDRTLAELAK